MQKHVNQNESIEHIFDSKNIYSSIKKNLYN